MTAIRTPSRTRVPRAAALPLALALAAAAPAALAQPGHLSPGLWQQTTHMKSQSGEMEKQMAQAQQRMASLPPETRAMVEAQMRARGMQLGESGQGVTVKMCISKQMSERDPSPPPDSHCQNEVVSRSGSTVKYRFSCAGVNGRPPTTGEGTFTMTSATSYTSHSVVNTDIHGHPDRLESDASGQWLGADCGDLKPLDAAAR